MGDPAGRVEYQPRHHVFVELVVNSEGGSLLYRDIRPISEIESDVPWEYVVNGATLTVNFHSDKREVKKLEKATKLPA